MISYDIEIEDIKTLLDKLSVTYDLNQHEKESINSNLEAFERMDDPVQINLDDQNEDVNKAED